MSLFSLQGIKVLRALPGLTVPVQPPRGLSVPGHDPTLFLFPLGAISPCLSDARAVRVSSSPQPCQAGHSCGSMSQPSFGPLLSPGRCPVPSAGATLVPRVPPCSPAGAVGKTLAAQLCPAAPVGSLCSSRELPAPSTQWHSKKQSHFFSQRNYFYCQSEPVLLQFMAFHSHPPSRQLWEKPNPASLVTNSSQSCPFSREQAQNPGLSAELASVYWCTNVFSALYSSLQLRIFKHSHAESTIHRKKKKCSN